jgi:hypothetical protein
MKNPPEHDMEGESSMGRAGVKSYDPVASKKKNLRRPAKGAPEVPECS